MTYATYADVYRPAVQPRAFFYDAALVIAGSLFIALSAQLAVRLPFTPVPITAQTLAVLLTGALLGWRRGIAAVLLYLGEGLAGLPVFAGGGAGPGHMAGPTGGYLVGFLLAAFTTGWLAERGWDRRFGKTFLAMLAGNVLLYVPGLLWLAKFVGAEKVFALGLYPFIIGDLLKIVIAAALLPAGWKLLSRSRR